MSREQFDRLTNSFQSTSKPIHHTTLEPSLLAAGSSYLPTGELHSTDLLRSERRLEALRSSLPLFAFFIFAGRRVIDPALDWPPTDVAASESARKTFQLFKG